jgi:hypothetical protein
MKGVRRCSNTPQPCSHNDEETIALHTDYGVRALPRAFAQGKQSMKPDVLRRNSGRSTARVDSLR